MMEEMYADSEHKNADEKILFSIIIPTYNRAAFILKTISSVLAQEYGHFELIIVDDGSTDHTAEIVRGVTDERVFYLKKRNAERAAARNAGVQRATGRYVTFVDSDDLLRSNYLSVARDFIVQHESPVFFHTGYDIVDTFGRILQPWTPLPSPANHKLIDGNFLSCMGVFIRTEVATKERFNEDRDLSGSEDYELWLRLAAKYRLLTSPVSTACLVNHESRSMKNDDVAKLKKRIALLKTCIMENDLFTATYKRHLPRLHAYLDLYLALHLAVAGSKRDGMVAMKNALIQYPPVIFGKRYWAALRKLIV